MRHLITCAVVLGLSGYSFADTIYVPADYPTIQEAIDASSNSDEIIVSEGTYFENITFLGKAITVRSTDPTTSWETTIIDGGGTSNTVVVIAANEESTTVLDGFTITGGNTSLQGGGMLLNGTSPIIRNCLVTGNTGDTGGGITTISGSPQFINCTIENNLAYISGGGIDVQGGYQTFTDCTIRLNTPDGINIHTSQASFEGVDVQGEMVGVHIELGLTQWDNCTISGCSAGGMRLTFPITDTFTNCSFSGNAAQDGGGVWANLGSTEFAGCAFSNNSANEHGGGIYIQECNTTFSDCTFSSNMASDDGGSIYSQNSDTSITSSIFSDNSAIDDGGSIYIQESNTIILDCTFTKNASTGAGGAFYSLNSNLNVDSSAFHFNSASLGGAAFTSGGTRAFSDCEFGSNTTSADGGAFHCLGLDTEPVSLTNCTFSTNAAQGNGGGLYVEDGTATMNGCQLNQNSAIYGGAAHIAAGSLSLSLCQFTNNTSALGGGAINANTATSLSTTTCTFTSNTSGNSDAGEGGGGLRLFNAEYEGINCTFDSNHSQGVDDPKISKGEGGAAWFSGTTWTMTSSTFLNNASSQRGGGIYNLQSEGTLTDCTFTGNTSGLEGGGVALWAGSNVAINSCQFSSNTSMENGDDGGGGGIYIHTDSSDIQTITDSTFVDNLSITGAGIYVSPSISATIQGCMFHGNYATDIGGGLYLTSEGFESASSLVEGCTFYNNLANNGGGAFILSTTAGISDCAFSYNTAYEDGAGLYIDTVDLQLQGCDFQNNSSVNGSGVFGRNSTSEISLCTFFANDASGNGGGIRSEDGSSTTLNNCPFTQNNAESNGGGVSHMGGLLSLASCDFEANTSVISGGAVHADAVNPSITDCIFTSNSSLVGGGMNVQGGRSSLSYCDFDGNSADYGGGLSCMEFDMNDCTFTDNTALLDGGGMCTDVQAVSECQYPEQIAQGPDSIVGLTSDSTAGYGVYENFRMHGHGQIRDITWWGIYADFLLRGTVDCGADGPGYEDNFTITYYMDNGGLPGSVLAGPFTGNVNVAATGLTAVSSQNGTEYVEYIYSFSHPPFSVTDGDCLWVSIINQSPGSCYWLWETAPAGDLLVYQSSAPDQTPPCDMSLCIGLPIESDGCGFVRSRAHQSHQLHVDSMSLIQGMPKQLAQRTVDIQSTAKDCQFMNNFAGGSGGGAYYALEGVEISDSIADSNQSYSGAGLYLSEGSVLRTDLTNNDANYLGGGLYTTSDTGVYLQDCLICDNTPDWVEGLWIDGTGNDFPVHCPNDCLGDYDSDGYVNVVDLLGLIGDWGICEPDSPCPADFNNDSLVNVDDLLTLIGSWGPCE